MSFFIVIVEMYHGRYYMKRQNRFLTIWYMINVFYHIWNTLFLSKIWSIQNENDFSLLQFLTNNYLQSLWSNWMLCIYYAQYCAQHCSSNIMLSIRFYMQSLLFPDLDFQRILYSCYDLLFIVITFLCIWKLYFYDKFAFINSVVL